jgi:hypothetical protein
MLGSLICGVYRIENAAVNSGWKSKICFECLSIKKQ